MTIVIRAILWWPQTAANLSMKRMQVVGPMIQEIQKKYKDNPEKMNKEMLGIYQTYGVNPVGGCLPMFIQLPVFLGFFYMLSGAIELRDAAFFWAADLSQPDTICNLPILGWRIPVNPMPLVMTASMYVSMHISPQPAGLDNPMVKVMKFMPLMFLVFCYNYGAALSLYWTVQNLLSILQMRYNMRISMPTLEQMKTRAKEKQQMKRNLKKGFGGPSSQWKRPRYFK
jgi:YidC/Oxa1 family membrane protein insertase